MVSRFGLRPVIVTGIVISGSGMILASFAKTVWQLYLTHGFMYGFGAGMALFTSVAISVQWFDKKRGLASGITVAGSGIGGAVLAPLNRILISKIGYQWALRIMGISTITIVCAVLVCIRTRIPPRKRGGPLFDVAMFKNSGFTLMYLMGMLVTFGYLTPIFLLPKFMVDLGMSPEVGASLVSVFSGVNAVSRILLGFVADWYGPLNMLILSTAFSGLACYIFWMTTTGLPMAVVFVVIYGINAGGFNSLFPVVAADVIGVEKLAAAVGLLYSGNFFGNLLGTPLASAIVTASGGRYTWTIVFAGTAPILGAALLLFIRFKHEKRIFVKM
ncbi:major facilitator superfamily domain-containing protein [Gamsiella multidivaricata]|uniref:major facilitator superfamily domain-containing protein n=1 Tax=Gamsiella multidivaricata TaxID=101098 RepID=UPI00221E9FE9|nr:major facilitator superfamily domain-containing protein [Gamsiella multidivaricata]KAI7829839.1 major facilitator superfamily domain-containing protein [Gamsiella multidivaricata]